MLFKENSTKKTQKVFTKVFTVGGIVSLSAGASIALSTPPSQAQNAAARGFYCDTSGGAPVTIYQNANGVKEPWIRWDSNVFRDYDPMRRCQEVSGRLETYRRNKQLKFITTGQMNKQNVICAVSRVHGPCGLIFTLKPGQNGTETLRNLLLWSKGAAGLATMSESDGMLFIDVRQRLGEDADSSTPAAAPSNAQPQPQPSNGVGREL